jgi:DNA-3-methyladenine glycosylase I
MPKPSTWPNPHKVEKPKDDNGYFDRMNQAIFSAGLNRQVIYKKWPGTRKAFDNFDINKVAKYLEPEVEELMNNPDVIHNLAKIRAIIKNAQEMQDIAAEYGSFASYLAEIRKAGGEEELKAGLSKRFAFLGRSSAVLFLLSVGEDLPDTNRQWHASH